MDVDKVRKRVVAPTQFLSCEWTGRGGAEKPNHLHRLLCAHRERPRRRTAEQRDELAADHSRTSSVLALTGLRKSHARTPTTLLAITASTIVNPNSAICTGSST